MDNKYGPIIYSSYSFNGQNFNFAFANPGNYNIRISSQTSSTTSPFYSTTEATINIFVPNSQMTGISPGLSLDQSAGLQNENGTLDRDSLLMPPPPNPPARTLQRSSSQRSFGLSGHPIPLGSPAPAVHGLLNRTQLANLTNDHNSLQNCEPLV